MKVQQLLAHHGIKENPFGQEDAQSDQVFKRHCLDGTYHPAWDKIFGSPAEPSTAVVFGEKGSGKTALRLQIVDQIARYNREHPEERVLVIEYDDLNPFLDCFRDRLFGRKRRPERTLESWRLWDHMDAILTLGVTRVVDGVLNSAASAAASGDRIEPAKIEALARLDPRDLLLLAAFYDRSLSMPKKQRWNLLRRKLRYRAWPAEWDRALGIAAIVATIGVLAYNHALSEFYESWKPSLIILAAWLPWLWRHGTLFWKAWGVTRQGRVVQHHPNLLRQLLSKVPPRELLDQPVPNKERSEDRYDLINKFPAVLRPLR